jgi:hypothetical protein
VRAQGPIHRFFSADHSRLDELLARAVMGEGPIDLAPFGQFRSGLLRHIAMEEKVLFTAARAARGGDPLPMAARLRVDHGTLVALLVPPPTRDRVAEIRSVPPLRRRQRPGRPRRRRDNGRQRPLRDDRVAVERRLVPPERERFRLSSRLAQRRAARSRVQLGPGPLRHHH